MQLKNNLTIIKKKKFLEKGLDIIELFQALLKWLKILKC